MMNITELFRFFTDRFSWVTPAGLAWLALCLSLGAVLVQADSPNRVGLVVSHDGEVITRCVEFSEEAITGYEILQRSGLDLNADVTSGMGAAICRLDGQGCTYPADDCFCQCQGAECVFWRYWQSDGQAWRFSSMGATGNKVQPGQVEGWSWSAGDSGSGGQAPPFIPFEEICAAAPTDTPVPTATNTPVPPTATPTLVPTDTPEPTNTPKPEPTPVIHSFSADRTTVTAGEGVTLTWDVSKAEAVYLRGPDGEHGVVAPGSQTVFPSQTSRYSLVARKDDGEAILELTITVNPAPNAPTNPAAQSAAASTATVPAAEAAALTSNATPLATPAGAAPVITLAAAAPSVPAGACTQLTWHTTEASSVYLDGLAVEPQGNHTICPGQTEVYTLRAVGPGGEREAQLTLQVTAPLQVEASPTLVPVTPTVSEAPATAIAVAPNPAPTTASPAPAGSEAARRFSVAAETEAGDSSWLVYGGVIVAVGLFLVGPVLLLGVGWVAWWTRKR